MTKLPRGHRKSPLGHDPEALAWALKKSGLTQVAFAEQIGKSAGLVSEILKGTRNATPALLLEMAKALNCPIVVLEAKRDTVAS
jgi:transcriptional regulator with XRE-family HTH domain